MMRIEAIFDLSIPSGRLMFDGTRERQSKRLRRKKIVACFCTRRAAPGPSGMFRSATSSVRWGAKHRAFRARTGGLAKVFSVVFCSSPRHR
jgi:hypothetical protein